MPIKCPVAPLEFAFLADWFLTERGLRDRTGLVYVTPLDGAFTRSTASQMLTGLLEAIPEFNEMISDSGGGLYACKASVDMFKLTRADFIDQVQAIITVGEFYQKAGGGQIIFT